MKNNKNNEFVKYGHQMLLETVKENVNNKIISFIPQPSYFTSCKYRVVIGADRGPFKVSGDAVIFSYPGNAIFFSSHWNIFQNFSIFLTGI